MTRTQFFSTICPYCLEAQICASRQYGTVYDILRGLRKQKKTRMSTQELDAIALTIRSLTIDAVQRAESGHPGAPLGLAEFGAFFFTEVFIHHSGNAKWINRDRFILSMGHASMWLYSLLMLSGYPITIEDIKKFRSIYSKTPGHPEFSKTPGVEMTTGPLGEGFTSAVGIAIAETMLSKRFNRDSISIISHYTYVLVSDGCLMEGVTSEAASLAGELQLGKLIVFYDSNRITIDGSTQETFSENVEQRFQAYGWSVYHADPYDYQSMRQATKQAKNDFSHPSLIILPSILGKGSPNKENTAACHGAPLGHEEVILTKKNLSLPLDQDFYIDPLAVKAMEKHNKELSILYEKWEKTWVDWKSTYPCLFDEWMIFQKQQQYFANLYKSSLPSVTLATREASGNVLNALSLHLPFLIGGSADLSSSTKTYMIDAGKYQASNHMGRNILFGVREHAMAGIVNGLNLYGGLRAYASTFLVFSDYMRPAIRLASIMGLPSLFIFSHDSFHVGEDGSTHQPIEHLENLRLIPNLQLLRPADSQEVEWAWNHALSTKNKPSILCLTRQKVAQFEKPKNWFEEANQGAYIVKESSTHTPQIVLIATGSEVSLSLSTQTLLEQEEIPCRVVSMICREIFLEQTLEVQKKIIPNRSNAISVEAGVSGQWYQICAYTFSIHRFGISGNSKDLCKYFQFTSLDLFAFCKKISSSKVNRH